MDISGINNAPQPQQQQQQQQQQHPPPVTQMVTKRNGSHQIVNVDEIRKRIMGLIKREPSIAHTVDGELIISKVIAGLSPFIRTTELDKFAAETAAYLSTVQLDYNELAKRLIVSNLHKETSSDFYLVMKTQHNYTHLGKESRQISPQFLEFVYENRDRIEDAINYSRDYLIDYFGIMTLLRSYLVKLGGKTVERPQHMIMRVALAIHFGDIEMAIATYNSVSQLYCIHATPTLLNAGTITQQMASCFLVATVSDSVDGIYNTLWKVALISKNAGGQGIAVHNIRATNSYIRGTNGKSSGLVPMLRVFDDTAKYIDQCFEADAIVYTMDGPKKICDIIAGDDRVLTHTGKFQNVDRLVVHDISDTELVEVSTKSSYTAIRMTKQHQVLALSNEHLAFDHDTIRDRIDKKHAMPAMIDAEELKEGDMLCFPIPAEISTLASQTWTSTDYEVYGALFMAELDRLGVMDRLLLSLPVAALHHFLRGLFSSQSNNIILDIDEYISNIPLFNEEEKEKSTALYHALLKSCEPTDIFILLDKQEDIEVLCWILLRCGVLAYQLNGGKGLAIPRVETILHLLPSHRNKVWIAVDPPYLVHNNIIYSTVESVKISTVANEGKLYDLEVSIDHTYVTKAGIVHNGGGKRKGAFAIYLEPWHADVFEFINLKHPHGNEELRARSLFYALWIPDLFMKRVKEDGDWTLMCPNEAPGLFNVWGKQFEELYTSYEKQPERCRRVIKARTLYKAIVSSMFATGGPYILFKDSCNRKSNQKNLGTIQCSNLCTEIIQFTSPEETAVCNLASIALPKFIIKTENIDLTERKTFVLSFDFKKLYDVVYMLTVNLNNVIKYNYYPIPCTKTSNMKHMPIGIGVQGLADAFALMRTPFDSSTARTINRKIFETIYYAALCASCDLAKKHGPYPSYREGSFIDERDGVVYYGSPMSNGFLQFDMWGKVPSDDWPWQELREKIKLYGVRNSLLIAPMPTASTSQILGNNECFEPYTSNIYSRRVTAGEFIIVNSHLVKDLMELGLWDSNMKDRIILEKGSIQSIEEIPLNIRVLYKTAREMSMKVLIDMAADRGAFVDQSQSMNLYVNNRSHKTIYSMLMYAWEVGLKTGCYYLHSNAAIQAAQFSIDAEKSRKHPIAKNATENNDNNNDNNNNNKDEPNTHTRDNPAINSDSVVSLASTSTDQTCEYSDECFSCGS